MAFGCGVLEGHDGVALVLVRHDAVNAEELGALEAEGFDFLGVGEVLLTELEGVPVALRQEFLLNQI